MKSVRQTDLIHRPAVLALPVMRSRIGYEMLAAAVLVAVAPLPFLFAEPPAKSRNGWTQASGRAPSARAEAKATASKPAENKKAVSSANSTAPVEDSDWKDFLQGGDEAPVPTPIQKTSTQADPPKKADDAMQEPASVPIAPAPPGELPSGQQPLQNGWTRIPELRLMRPAFVHLTVPPPTQITFFANDGKPVAFQGNVTVGLRGQCVYVFRMEKLSDLAVGPFYGTIEVVHAAILPVGASGGDVAIPVLFDDQDVDALVKERMITKFVVLDAPDSALALDVPASEPIRYDVSFAEDAVAAANAHGKIVLVVRIGNRVYEPSELVGMTPPTALWIPRNLRATHSVLGEVNLAEYFVDADTKSSVIRASFHHHKKGGRGQSGPCPGGQCPSGSCAGACCPPGAAPGFPGRPFKMYRDLGPGDEYLCDGGDRDLAAFVDKQGRLLNVGDGDTVATFRDHAGKLRVIESNRVCLYAPRYVEVRLVQAPDGLDHQVGPLHLERDRMVSNYRQVTSDSEVKRYKHIAQVRSRERASGFVYDERVAGFHEVSILLGFEQDWYWAAEKGLMVNRHVVAARQLMIQRQVDFARELSREQFPQIVAMDAGTGELIATKAPKDYVGIDEKPKSSNLEIKKTVDKTTVVAGDVVTFEIHYRNAGTEPVADVVIVDSLTARLGYVAESAESSRKAVFTAEDNDVGSSLLRWQLEGPLNGGEAGVVRFRARVR